MNYKTFNLFFLYIIMKFCNSLSYILHYNQFSNRKNRCLSKGNFIIFYVILIVLKYI